MNYGTKIGIALACILSFASCKKENNAPIVPQIESLNYEISADKKTVVWTIGFTDGDGDIGFEKEENKDNEALKLFLFGRSDSNFVEGPPTSGYLIDYIENVNPNRPLKGKIIIHITEYLDFIENKYKAFYYEAILIDRKGHQSNRIKSTIVEF